MLVNGAAGGSGLKTLCCLSSVQVEPELLHTYSKVYKADVLLLIVRLAVLTAVTLTVPVVLFPVRVPEIQLLFSRLLRLFRLVEANLSFCLSA